MVRSLPLAVAAASLLFPPALADGLYTKSSPVLQISGSNYDSLIAKSNHTSILEFYAPWCGHCQNLKPAYEKAAKSLTGLAKVGAVNCDEESNKPFCGSMGVQGFPTLKVVKPGKKSGKPIVEDYQGARTAKAIVDAVIEKIPNHVKRLSDKDYQIWLEDGDGAKAILFSDKGSTSATLKAIAVDFLGTINIAQIRDKEKEAVTVFHVEEFPALVLLPGDGKDPVTFDGEMKKDAMVSFLSQAAAPNPDPAPKKAKSTSSSKSKVPKASASAFSKASESQASSQAKTDKASQTMETVETMDDERGQPTESPNPNVVTDDTQKPIKIPDIAPPIASLSDSLPLQQKCLNTKSGTCILALLPETEDPSSDSIQVISSLSEIHHKHEQAKRNLFPFLQLPSTNPEAAALREKLSLGAGIELIALNGKRTWYRHYSKSLFSQAEVENWIDEIRMGDGAKSKLPEDLVVDAAELPQEPAKSEPQMMKEKLMQQVPEGVDFDFEELNDDEYEKILRQANKAAKDREAEPDPSSAPEEHDEL